MKMEQPIEKGMMVDKFQFNPSVGLHTKFNGTNHRSTYNNSVAKTRKDEKNVLCT